MDFKKLSASKQSQTTIDPLEIFRQLPKPTGINDLYLSQAEVLKTWFQRREQRDTVIKLHTGGGKTLVGLLIAQSVLNETGEPVMYVSPNKQLQQQTFEKAQEYSISAVLYDQVFPNDFHAAKSVLICNYHTLFNGRSRFGIAGSHKNIVHVAAIILDDAHVAFSTVREQFTFKISKKNHQDAYDQLIQMFRPAFQDTGKLGTFDDIVYEKDQTVLEVPYWSWKDHQSHVRSVLKDIESPDKDFVWPFLKDNLQHCHCLITQSTCVITPILPLVDMVPTFNNCTRRIFMSATIGDDSAIIRTFDADPKLVKEPVTSTSLAGVSERMILIPELMSSQIDNIPELLRQLLQWVTNTHESGAVILTPSEKKACIWQDIATYPKAEDVSISVKQLQDGISYGPFVFANRYDGIDLPNNACRLLVINHLPLGVSEYDLYRSTVFSDGVAINSELAQRIEQGMGRGARGTGDYCIVIVFGKDIVAWLSKTSNRRLLTSSTRAQLDMGMEISEQVENAETFRNVLLQCLSRDKGWVTFHARNLAESTQDNTSDTKLLQLAAVERKAYKQMRDGYYEKAIQKIQTFCNQSGIDTSNAGWMMQLAARSAYYADKPDDAHRLQKRAYGLNNNLTKPKTQHTYNGLVVPSSQAHEIINQLKNFHFRKGYLAEFDANAAYLVPDSTAAQFEQAFEKLGHILGFAVDRPDKKYGKGPDVLWLLPENLGLVIEVKSQKQSDNPLTKSEHGQLLQAGEWFAEEYPTCRSIRVCVHPNSKASKSTTPGESKVLTLNKLQDLVRDTRSLLRDLCASTLEGDALKIYCERLLTSSKLNPEKLVQQYLLPFEVEA